MKNKCTIVILFICATIAGVFGATSTQTAVEPRFSGLLHKDVAERIATVNSIYAERAAVVTALCQSLQDSLDKTDVGYDGKLHAIIRLTGLLRVEEAAELLVSIIDFRLDSATFPPGARYANEAYYPAAAELGRIGGKKVINVVLARMLLPCDEPTIRLCTYVLNECWGGRPADSAVLMAERAKSAGTESERANFSQAVKILQERREIVPTRS